MKGLNALKAILLFAAMFTFLGCEEEPILENESSQSVGGGGYDPDNRQSNDDAGESPFRD